MVYWWPSSLYDQGTGGTGGTGLNSLFTVSQTAMSGMYTPTSIWWSGTGAATTTVTTSTWSSTPATTSIYYQQQMQRASMLQQMSQYQQPFIDRDEVARRLYGNLMGNTAPREERQVMAAPAILRAREAPVALRARDLLISFLSDDQRRTYEEHNWFIVVGGRSGRRYRINGGTYAGNVDLLAANDNNKVEARFCGHCDASIPLGDQLLAQKVMLEVDEPAYIALANRRAA